MGWFETYLFREPKDITAWLALLVSVLSLTISYGIFRREQKKFKREQKILVEKMKPSFDFKSTYNEFFHFDASGSTPSEESLPKKMTGPGWRVRVGLSITNNFENKIMLLRIKAKREDSQQPMFLYRYGVHFRAIKDYSEILAIPENPMSIESKHTDTLSFCLIFPDNTVEDNPPPRVMFTIYLRQDNGKWKVRKTLKFISINNITPPQTFSYVKKEIMDKVDRIL